MSNTKVTIDVGVNASADGLDDIKRQAADVEAAQKSMADRAGEAGKEINEAWREAVDTFKDLKALLPGLLQNLKELGDSHSSAQTQVLKQLQDLQNGHNTALSDILKQNGAQNAAILPEILKQLQALQGQQNKGPTKNPMQDNSPEGLLQRVQGNLITTEAYISAAMKPSDFAQIQKRISIAQSLLGQASQGGADQQKVQDLTTKINELTKALESARDAHKGNNPPPNPGGGSGGFGGSPTPPPSSEGGGVNAGQMVLNTLGMFRNGGMLGMLGQLGMPGLIAGSAIGAINYVDRSIQRSNDLARRTVQADADLARQYGIESDPLKIFRGSDLLTRYDISKLGYTAAQAGQVAATYNLPGGMRGDVTNLLTFSRVNGMDEGMVAQAGRSLSMAGALERGNNLQGLQTLSMAMAEGIKEGVAGSDIFRTLVNYADAQLKQGVTSTQQSLQYMAGLQQALASTGNRALQGEAGAKTMDSLMGGITGKDDYSAQAYLFQSTGGFSAKELGLTGKEAVGYTKLQQSSPFMAFQQALNLIRGGRGSGASKTKLAKAMYQASGGNMSVLSGMLSDWGIEGDAQLEFLGQQNGFVGTFQQTEENAGRYAKAGPLIDPQGKNRIAYNTLYKDAMLQETSWLNSATSLAFTGTLEERLTELRFKVAQAVSKLGGASTILQPGNLSGEPGAGSTTTPPGSTAARFAPDKTLYAIAEVESTGGRNPNMDKGDGARGAWQLYAQNLVGWDPSHPNPAGDYDKKYLGKEILGKNGKPMTDPAEARAWISSHPEQVQKIVQGFIAEKGHQLRAKYNKQGVNFQDRGGENYFNAVIAAATGILWHNGDKWDGILGKDGKLLLPEEWSDAPRQDGVSDKDYGDRIFNAYMNGAVGPPAPPKPAPPKPAPPKKLTPEQQEIKDFNDALNTMNVTNVNMETGQAYSAGLRAQYPNLPEVHQGVDFRIGGMGGGDEIRNPFVGAKVLRTSKGDNDGYGNMVVLQLQNGLKAKLAHLQEINVKAGQVLKQQDLIGLEGSTGNADGPHLHMELLKGGKAITDQDEWWKAFMDATTPKAPPKTQTKGKNGKTSMSGPGGTTAMLLPELLPPTQTSGDQRIVVEVRGLDNINVTGTNTQQAKGVKTGVEHIVQAVLPQPTGHVGT